MKSIRCVANVVNVVRKILINLSVVYPLIYYFMCIHILSACSVQSFNAYQQSVMILSGLLLFLFFVPTKRGGVTLLIPYQIKQRIELIW